MAILSTDDRITADAIPLELRSTEPTRGSAGLQDIRDTAERDRIRQVLDQTGWNVAAAARLLDTERTALHKRIRALGLKRH
jgi:two-component system nitrogen regulation response regulator NtrX